MRIASSALAAAAALWALACNAGPPAPGLHGRVVAVGDGDSLTISVDGAEVELRLAEIDAPELAQPYGERARAALVALVGRRDVDADVVDIDQYHRRVSQVFVDGVHVNRELVRDGYAWANTRFVRTHHVIDLEAEARAARRGLWALPAAERDPPWEWRREHGTRSHPR